MEIKRGMLFFREEEDAPEFSVRGASSFFLGARPQFHTERGKGTGPVFEEKRGKRLFGGKGEGLYSSPIEKSAYK